MAIIIISVEQWEWLLTRLMVKLVFCSWILVAAQVICNYYVGVKGVLQFAVCVCLEDFLNKLHVSFCMKKNFCCSVRLTRKIQLTAQASLAKDQGKDNWQDPGRRPNTTLLISFTEKSLITPQRNYIFLPLFLIFSSFFCNIFPGKNFWHRIYEVKS